MIICNLCGTPMQFVGGDEWLCMKCGEFAWGTEENHYYEFDEDDGESSDDSGCRACGNPDYPLCKTSCSLFDE